MAKVQVGVVPLQAPPCHPAKTILASGVTVSLMEVPEARETEQPVLFPVRQEIPLGVLTTEPVPEPVNETVN